MKRTICIIASLTLIFQSLTAGKPNPGLHTIVIDPGHGGVDVGAVSRDKKIYEKNITLDISNRLAEKIRAEFEDVDVRMTRSTDETLKLSQRARTANDANADLFISIHVNSSVKTSPNGFSVHILGQSDNPDRDLFAYNMDVCKRENSVVLLEDDYSTRYEGFDPDDPESVIFMMLMQNSHLEQSLNFAQKVESHLKGGPISADRGIWQNPFLVLWQTSMPAVLVELGFISNSSDLGVLLNSDNQDMLAGRILDAIREYKIFYDASVR